MSLEVLLRKAAGAGGREIHLAAARRITIVTNEGEREMTRPEVTPQLLQQFIAPVVPPAARDALAAGRAEWTLRHGELGRIRVVAEHERASFFFDGAAAVFSGAVAVFARPRHFLRSPVSTSPMPWRFRKTLSLFGTRFTLSRRGLGTSWSLPGFRLGVNAQGRWYVSFGIPGTGLYYIRTF
jgi:hypothetical protein